MDPRIDAKPYLHPTWCVMSNVAAAQADHDRSCDNFHYYTAHWFNVLYQRGLEVPKEHRESYEAFAITCEVAPGLINRYPEYRDLTSHDELTGAAYIAWAIAFEIYNYGAKHKWCWNNMTPGMWERRAYFGRFIDFVPFLKCAAGLKINILQQVLWALATWHSTTSPKDDTSGKLIKYLHLSKMANAGWLVRLSIKHWQRKMSRMYPGGVREVLAIYFGSSHPITQYAREDFNVRGI